MSVSAVSSSSASSVQMPVPSTQSIAEIQKEISTVQKQIIDENKSSDDSKTKTQVVQELEAELQALQLMVQQKMTQQAQAQQSASAVSQTPSQPIKAGIDDGVGVNLNAKA